MGKKINVGLIIGLICSIMLLWLLAGFISYIAFNDWPERGLFGDMFGAINALFSGLALAGVIIAIIFQSKELELQRQELEATREELRGQKEQMELQNKTIALQTFENTFFNLFKLHVSLVDSFDVTGMIGKTTTGKRIFEYIWRDWKGQYDKLNINKNEIPKNEIYTRSYNKISSIYRGYFSTYLNNLLNLLSFIETAPTENKDIYRDNVFAQFWDNELLLLFYHCYSDYGKEQLRELLIRYDIPNKLSVNKLFNENDITGFYQLSSTKSSHENQTN